MLRTLLSLFALDAAILCARYGLTIRRIRSGTHFFAVWFALAFGFFAASIGIWFSLDRFLPSGVLYAMLALLAVFLAGFCAFCLRVRSQARAAVRPGLSHLLVLGAQVRPDGPSPVLQHRLDRALAYLQENPNTQCILSGGQGANEPQPEAETMADYLRQRGIPSARLILECASRSTEENIQNCLPLLPPGARVGLVTNNFHLFRAMQIAKACGLSPVFGVAAPSNRKFLPNNLLREYLAEIKFFLRRARRR